MAIPFFMFAGSLMATGGMSRRLIRLASALVGWITGGLTHVMILASAFFAALSGSAPATCAAIGGMMIPEMKEKGFPPEFSAGVQCVAGTIGPKTKFDAHEVWVAFKDAIWALLVPVIILGGIYSGIFTPTEAGAVAAVYGLLAGSLIYRELKPKDLLKILVDTAANTSLVLLIIGCAGAFTWVLTIKGIAAAIGSWFAAVCAAGCSHPAAGSGLFEH